MSQEKVCKFCGQKIEDVICNWCGFSQEDKENIPSTLSYAQKLKNYVVGDPIAITGESLTYLAFDTASQQKVLLKEFLPITMLNARQGLQISVKEEKQVLFKNLMFDFTELYETLQKIESPALPKVYAVFYANKTAYAVVENVQGTTLKQVLIKRGKPFSFKEARWMFEDLFKLLEKMSNLNISHGGISDETVIFTPDNTIVLTGFAIQDLRTKNDHISYKLYDGFSAPEQYHPNKFQGFYTDIYSIACLLYYSITGSLLQSDSLEVKDIVRILPRYAVEALKYATKENPEERIDTITDFVLMLDDKAVIENKKTKAQPIKETETKRLIQYAVLAILTLLILVFAFNSIGGKDDKPSQSSSDTSQTVVEKIVPNFVGKSYAQVINNENYQQDYTFVKLDEYNNEHEMGVVCKQSPQEGQMLATGSTIYLTVSLGKKNETVPDGLVGISYNDAVQILDRLGIKHKKQYVDQTSQYVAGMVAAIDKQVGETIDVDDDVITLYVANDKPLATSTPPPTPTPTPVPTPVPTPSPTPTPDPTLTPETTPEQEPTAP